MEHDPTTALAKKLDTAADETTLSLAEFVPTAKRGVLLGIGAWLLLKQGAANTSTPPLTK